MVNYADLYSASEITASPLGLAQLLSICDIALENKYQYLPVSILTHIPWPVIAALHFRESNQRFSCHLHNGDPLTARTVHVPRGRPLAGEAPFSWRASAIDALSAVWKPKTWNVAGCLEFAEKYNGVGYQKHAVNTPYVWDFTNQYTKGLYVADGSFDPNAFESRPGVASILKTLNEKRGVSLDFVTVPNS